MTTTIIIIFLVVGVILLISYSNKETQKDKEFDLKDFKIRSIMTRLNLKNNQYAILNDGLLLTNEKQIIQIKIIYDNSTVLLVNRQDPKKQKRIKLHKFDLENLDNIRMWILNNLYSINNK